MRILHLMAAIGLVTLTQSPHLDGMRRVLTDSEMRSVVGGEAAAVTFKTPRTLLSHIDNPASGSLKATNSLYNDSANRCIYATSKGPSNVGFDVAASGVPSSNNYVFVIHGTAAPKLELYADGVRITGLATGTLAGTDPGNSFDLYTASLTTKCVGGSNNGQVCHTNFRCPGGTCRTCDQAGNCNSNTNPSGPCPGFCVLGTNATKACYVAGDCPGGTCQANSQMESGSACYFLNGCVAGSGGGLQCLVSGSDDSGGTGPLHMATARVTHGSAVIGYDEVLVRVTQGNSSDPTDPGPPANCSTNCKGPIDTQQGGNPPPACE